MSGEANALEHVPSVVLWYILLGRKDLDACIVARPWTRATNGYQRLLATPRSGVLSPDSFLVVVVPAIQPCWYEVIVNVPNRNQHYKRGFPSAEAAMDYADAILTTYGIPYMSGDK